MTVIVAGVWLLDVWYFVPSRTGNAVVAAAVAAAVCWFSSSAALVVTVGCAKSRQAMAGALGGVIFRTGGPLAALAAGSQVPWLVREKFAGQLVAFFLVSLALETVLAVRLANRAWGLKMWWPWRA